MSKHWAIVAVALKVSDTIALLCLLFAAEEEPIVGTVDPTNDDAIRRSENGALTLGVVWHI